jgi:Photosynthetic reaction centre cytochrome C subunit
MKNLKNQTIIIGLLFFAVVSIAAIIPVKQNPPLFKNLKVLPKNISQVKLDSIMDKYNYALGVSCNFCHAKNKAGTELAFELDTKSEKEITRKMMLMTYDINTKYFYEKPNRLEGQRITCNTCHNQKAYPEESK